MGLASKGLGELSNAPCRPLAEPLHYWTLILFISFFGGFCVFVVDGEGRVKTGGSVTVLTPREGGSERG